MRLKQNQFGWDFDMLPNLYEREELIEWGLSRKGLGGCMPTTNRRATTPAHRRPGRA